VKEGKMRAPPKRKSKSPSPVAGPSCVDAGEYFESAEAKVHQGIMEDLYAVEGRIRYLTNEAKRLRQAAAQSRQKMARAKQAREAQVVIERRADVKGKGKARATEEEGDDEQGNTDEAGSGSGPDAE
jgi:hypothetical protein